jgi:hypothetical protein
MMMRQTKKNDVNDFKRREIAVITNRPEKQPIKVNFKPVKYFFGLLVIVCACYYLFLSDAFRIKEVQVDGIRSIDIISRAKTDLEGKNILTLNISNFLESLTKEYPVIEEIKVVRGLPNKIMISGSERESALIFCSKECFKIDPSGYVYEKVEKPEDKIFLQEKTPTDIQIGEQVVGTKFILFYIKCVDEMQKMNLTVKSAEVSDLTFSLSVLTSEGWRAIFDTSQSLDNQLYALGQVLEKNKGDLKEYANLGVEGQVYLK